MLGLLPGYVFLQQMQSFAVILINVQRDDKSEAAGTARKIQATRPENLSLAQESREVCKSPGSVLMLDVRQPQKIFGRENTPGNKSHDNV